MVQSWAIVIEEIALKCSKFGTKPFVLPLDILDYNAQEEAYKTIISKFGRIDILVLNAGVSQRLTAIDTPLSVTQDLMNLNFISFVSLTKLALPSMIKQQQGQIVVVSSLSGIIGTPMGSSYSASKFALNGYFNALRSEVAMNGITISIICPGPVVSEISDKAHRDNSAPQTKEGGKMPTARCTYLIAKAMSYKWAQVWISDQPYLALTYIAQYMPYLNNLLFTKIIGPGRVKVVQSGGHGYDFKAIVGLK